MIYKHRALLNRRMTEEFEFKSTDYPELVKDSNDWGKWCISEFAQEYFINISKKIKENYDSYDCELDVYPPKNLIFNAFELTPFQEVKVVLIGQGYSPFYSSYFVTLFYLY